ncbi:pickpocket protein 28-like [Episyrphus balteatus]|uniref:pickpocket protein 28-like n=1 Tax=Episyrphus balteatus TaxID=286459 RepID=UPI002485D621|nr:pickpocket protein 28-like [Episyrphus balteatus]
MESCDSIGKRIKYGTPFQAFKGIFFDYFNESSIHGFKYVGEQKRSALERQYFREFGSQTGCIIPGLDSGTTYSNEFIQNASKYIKFMLNVAPTFEEIMSGCFWKDKVNCEDLFDPVLTEDGICFSFNLIKSENYQSELNNFDNNDRKIDWDLEHGYNEEALYSLEAFPFHAVGAGITESFVLIPTDEIEDEDNKCRTYLQDFKLIVQTPGEVPQVKKNFINIPFDHDVLLTIKPQIMTTSEGLRHYTPERRQCYYQNERYLRYFTKYTQANCELECLANQTLAKCGCVKFSMPRSLSHPICGSKKVFCADQIANNFSSWKFMAKTKPFGESACTGNCLPTCFDIKYKAEIEQQIPGDGITKLFRLTLLQIKFEEDVFNGLLRSELYSITDFIANCGGLLGLFMGVSILSLVELVYFFTVRLLMNLKERRQIQDVEQCWEKK